MDDARAFCVGLYTFHSQWWSGRVVLFCVAGGRSLYILDGCTPNEAWCHLLHVGDSKQMSLKSKNNVGMDSWLDA